MPLTYRIVRVIDRRWLVDREMRRHAYATRDGTQLAPGVYVVMWPTQAARKDYDGNARYLGPFEITQDIEPLLHRCIEEYLTERRSSVAGAPAPETQSIH